MSKKVYNKALTIAGSDSGGGAGIQADLKTFSALACYGSSVIVALTAQNTKAVTDIHVPEPEFVRSQIKAVLEDIGADAVKLGMLVSADMIKAVAEELKRFEVRNVVLDPVMVAKSGDKLLQDDAREALVQELFPLSKVITPNIKEAEVLAGRSITTFEEMEQAGRELLDTGAEAVVMKGGHLESETSSKDALITGGEVRWFDGKRVATQNTHGTGCTFSSAITAYLAQGTTLAEAVNGAKQYMTGAIGSGATYKIGEGHGPVHHFYQFWG